jgi:hypothetical protein
MRIQSAKSKGRRLQQAVAKALVDASNGALEPDDVRSTAMGVNGADVQLSPAARRIYPFDIECKNVEKLNIWDAIAQAKTHGPNKPAVCFSRNNEDIYIAIKLEDFLQFYKKVPT